MRLPLVSGKEVIAFLIKQGFEIRRQRGSHVSLFKEGIPNLFVTVPLHARKEISPGTLLSIIKQAGMTKEQFTALINR